jgi:hypothetical protein
MLALRVGTILSDPFCWVPGMVCMAKWEVHQGLDSWDQNDSFLNLNDHASKRPFFNIGSKIPTNLLIWF